MILNIDTRGKEFVVTKDPSPKLDNNGVQRVDKRDGAPTWSTEVVVTDDSGGEILKINTSGGQPDVERGDEVLPIGLEAIPWATNSRSGVSYRAERIELVKD